MPHRPDTYNAPGMRANSSNGHSIPSSENAHYSSSHSQQTAQPQQQQHLHHGRHSYSGGIYPVAAPIWHRHPSPPPEPSSKSTDSRKRGIRQTPEPEPKKTKIEKGFDTAEKTAASALLLAANNSTSSDGAVDPPSSGPPKKRKKHLDVLRRNGMENPCQVSPVSSESVSSAPHEASGTTSADDEFSPAAPPPTSSTSTPNGSSASSFDYKSSKTQALTDSAKIGDTNEISPHPAVRDFPSKLHHVLGSTDAHIVQWLPHGNAWRVLRWDALRRQVLPEHFPQLCEEGEEGSIDAFLWNVRAWGFEEIKDGHDVGAYSNRRFTQGEPDLCKQMKLSSVGFDGKFTKTSPQHDKHRTPPQALLRVPSLAPSRSDTVSNESKHRAATPDAPPAWYKPIEEDPTAQHHRHYRSVHGGSPYGWRVPVYDHYGGMHYHHEERMMMHHRHYPPASPITARSSVTCPPPYDSRYPFRPLPENILRPVHHTTPPQVRSGRGGSRVVRSDSRASSSSTEAAKRSFPVSQRGKTRRNRICRTPTAPSPDPTLVEEKKVQQKEPSLSARVAVAISRKTKRKLPLSRSASVTPVENESPEA